MALEVTTANFASDVIEASFKKPVLVDFWAEWCGPCRMLTPVLEKLEADFQGRFLLVKVNSDHNQEIAARYRVSGIPAVKLFVDGEIRDEFVGALPEAQVKRFLENNLPDPQLERIALLARESPVAAAEALLAEGVDGEDASVIYWNGALALLRDRGHSALAQIKKFLQAIPLHDRQLSDAGGSLLGFFEHHDDEENVGRLSRLVQDEEPVPVLDYFLKSVEQAGANERERAKLDLLACFHLLGNQGELVNQYRKKLSAVLF